MDNKYNCKVTSDITLFLLLQQTINSLLGLIYFKDIWGRGGGGGGAYLRGERIYM